MNITVPQDIQTKTELEELTDAKRMLITAQMSCPIMGLKQDGILGAYNMTKSNTRIDWRSVMNMIVHLKLPKNVNIDKSKIYTGHELFSLILPERINKSNNGINDDIQISSGKLLSGYLKNKALGDKQTNTIIQLILDEYGVDAAKDFFDNSQKLINQFNMYYGFSVGLSDTVSSNDVIRQIDDIKNKEILKASVYVTEYENNPSMFDPETFETTIRANLSNVMNDASSIISRNMTIDNSINVMATAGSKGGVSNTGQMIGLLGQQALEGARMPKKIGQRVLPYFHKNDDTATGRGFIGNSFLTGLNFQEFVEHNMAAREGLIDTAIKTADTGYTQRKLIKSLEDVQICYDGTIRTATGTIIQFIYGDSGTDTTRQYTYAIDMLLLDDISLDKKYKFTMDEIKIFNGKYTATENDAFFKLLMNGRDILRKTLIKTKLDSKTFKSYVNYMLPVNLTRIMDKAKNMVDGTISDLTPDYILRKIDTIMKHNNTQLVCSHHKTNENDSVKIDDENTAKIALKLAIYNALAPKRCIFEYKLSRDIFDYVIDEIIKNFRKNIADPGEMVGIIAVHALMPPLTQMTLNTFHQSGIGAKGHSTLGIPRLKELLSLTRSLKTPQMIVYLNHDVQTNKEQATRIAAYMKQTNLSHIRSKIEVYYDPLPTEIGSFKEHDHIGKPFYIHAATSNSCTPNIDDLPWLIRIEFDREKLLTKDVTLLDVQSKFCNMWESRFQDLKKVSKEERNVLEKVTRCGIACNNDNDDIPIMHIRFDMVNFTINTINDFIELIIDELKMKGIDAITDVYEPSEDPYINIDNPIHELKNDKEYTIHTAGINMYDIRCIEGVNIARTICNDIMQIYDIFGIEAARIALLREITTVLGGTFVNYHHLSILVDLMTRDGFLISIDRHGVDRTDAAPLGKVSFEKPIEQLVNAAVFNEIDPLHGVSARIMTGNVIKGGTGLCDVMLDSNMIERSEYIQDEKQIHKSVMDDSEMHLINDIVSKEYDDIFVPDE